MPKHDFNFWLDAPKSWKQKVRRPRLSGWCVAKKGEPPVAIRARLGRRIFPGTFDRERPEVLAALGQAVASTPCGFTIDLEVPPGKQKLEVHAARADGKWQTVFAREIAGPWRISAAERERWPERYNFYLDRPKDWDQPVRKLYLTGWCFDRGSHPIEGARAVVGRRIFPGNYGFARPDLGPIFPETRAAVVSGFAIAAVIPPGEHILKFQILGDCGWITLHTQKVRGTPAGSPEEAPPQQFAVFQPGSVIASRFVHWLDEPKDWSKRTRYLRVSGWCVAIRGEPVSEVRARVRGQVQLAQHGFLRPDVALSFQNDATVLRSGFALDVVIPWGPSKLLLQARSLGGDWETFFAHPVRGPAFWARRGTPEEIGNYQDWIYLYERLTRRDQRNIRQQIAGFARQPRFSILLPVYNSDARWLRRAIDSVRRQLYSNWELCVVDDASTAPHVWPILQRAAQRDPRIKILGRETNGHISAASNDALALATGEFIGLLDHDDELAPTALYFAALALNQNDGLQLIYTDEDKLDPSGRRCDPYFKPDWDPDLLTSQNYLPHFAVYATELVRRNGGFRLGFEGSQDYDVALRCTEQLTPAQIHHIPRVLYHWRSTIESTAASPEAKPYAHDAALRAVQEHIDRGPAPGRVAQDSGTYLRVTYEPPPGNPLVSIIIPTRDRAAILRQCVESIQAKTDYPNFEITIVDNQSHESETLDYFASLAGSANVRILPVPGEFNFSRLNNLAVAQARGVFIALLNNDLEVVNHDWLSEMVGHAARSQIGAVGARLWFPDGTLQHGGVLLGAGGVANHAHRWLRRGEPGYFSRAQLTQNFSGVTGACMVLRKEVYEKAGGLDEVNLPVAFNDVDFCLRLRALGYFIVWTPHAQLIHHESASRGLEDTGKKQERFMSEVGYMEKTWGHLVEHDPYYNPNLSLGIEQQFKLAFPPRTKNPWDNS